MHVGHLHRKIFHVECWEFRPLCDKLFINNWYKREDGWKQERQNKTTFMDLIRSNKKGLRPGRFCSFQCFKIWPDCLNFKHWPILSSASGALLIFTVKSTLNYTRVLWQSTKKKKKIQLYPDQTPMYATSDQDVHGLGINLSNMGPTNRVRRGRKRVRSSGAFFYHSQ